MCGRDIYSHTIRDPKHIARCRLFSPAESKVPLLLFAVFGGNPFGPTRESALLLSVSHNEARVPSREWSVHGVALAYAELVGDRSQLTIHHPARSSSCLFFCFFCPFPLAFAWLLLLLGESTQVLVRLAVNQLVDNERPMGSRSLAKTYHGV